MDAVNRTRVRWILIGWTFLISAIAYLDRVNISIAGKAIAKEFQLTDIQLGYVFSAFVLGYALFQAPGGRMADRFGPRRTLTIAVVWWAIFTTLVVMVPSTLASSLILLIGIRFALGIGEAVVYPSSNRLVAEWIPSRERGLANGLIFAGVGAGAGVTPPLIVYVMETYGWHWSFVVSAAIGLAAGAVWWFIARDKPAEHPWVNAGERELIEAGLPHAKKSESLGVPWGRILASRELWMMTLSYFAYGYSAYIFFTWFFIYLNSVRGLDLKASRWWAMLPFIAMALASPVGGWISDRITATRGARIGRCGIAVVGIAFAAIFIALGTQVESAKLAAVVLAGGAGALYLSQSSFWAVTAEIAGPSSGTVSGIMNMGGQLGGALTASLSPWIAREYGWTASFLAAAGLCALASAAWFLVDPSRRLFEADSTPR
ncbi:MAG: MFS transporter [Acidobacteria bacterium]|nr:MFS transporter [Acidobacteriota bacterium]